MWCAGLCVGFLLRTVYAVGSDGISPIELGKAMPTSDAQTTASGKTQSSRNKMKPPYDIASKIVPLRFNVLPSSSDNNRRKKDDVTNALSGHSERKFVRQINNLATMSPSTAQKMKVDAIDQEVETAGKIDTQLHGEAYMQAYDAEKRRIGVEEAEKAARAGAVDLAVEVKAHAMMVEQKSLAAKAQQDVKAAEAKMRSAEQGVQVAGSAMQKGWLNSKLAAEMSDAQKDLLKQAEGKVKLAKKREQHVKKRLRKRTAHTSVKQKLALQGKRQAEAEVDKELAMKYVQSEFERRKKQEYHEKQKKVALNQQLQASGELMAKKDAALENRQKADENRNKGKAKEHFSKNKQKEKRQKLVIASRQPIPVDCGVGPWMPWSGCSRPCAGGMQARARQVLTPASTEGAQCTALTQSRPCNMQPCLSRVFGIGYCDRALSGCTKYRALEQGCHRTSATFGHGSGISKIMMDEHLKMEQKIASIQNHNNTVKWPVSNEHDKDQIDKQNQHEAAQAFATAHVYKVIENSDDGPGTTVSHPSHDSQQGPTSAKKLAETSQHKTSTQGRTSPQRQDAAIQFQFHDNGKGTAAILQAVSAAEHAVTMKEGAAAIQYTFKKEIPLSGESENDLGESADTSPQHPPPVPSSLSGKHITNHGLQHDGGPVKAQHRLSVLNSMSEVEAERCKRYQRAMAKYCGRMVDCVTKNVDHQDVQYSKNLQKILLHQTSKYYIPGRSQTSSAPLPVTTGELLSQKQITPMASITSRPDNRKSIRKHNSQLSQKGNTHKTIGITSHAKQEMAHASATEQQPGAGLFKKAVGHVFASQELNHK